MPFQIKRYTNLLFNPKNMECLTACWKPLCYKVIPGNCKSLWNAVKAAKDNGINQIPKSMTLGGKTVAEEERSDCFASFFETKVRKITNEIRVDPGVYNGSRKIFACDQMFMSALEVESCIRSIKVKKQ